MQSQQRQQKIHYTAIEPFPLEKEITNKLNYGLLLQQQNAFNALHSCEWGEDIKLNEHFTLHKSQISLQNFSTKQLFHLVYYDAFAPATQPELWTESIFSKLYEQMFLHAILVTYCSKGIVKRAMQTAGFTIEKLAGPLHKREMLRAKKTNILFSASLIPA